MECCYEHILIRLCQIHIVLINLAKAKAKDGQCTSQCGDVAPYIHVAAPGGLNIHDGI